MTCSAFSASANAPARSPAASQPRDLRQRLLARPAHLLGALALAAQRALLAQEESAGDEERAERRRSRPGGRDAACATASALTRSALAFVRSAPREPSARSRVASSLRARETTARVPIDAGGDVVAQLLVRDAALPPGCERAAEIADHHLIEDDTEAVEIGAFGGGPALDHLRRHVEARSRAGRRGAREQGLGQSPHRDARGRERLSRGDEADAEVGQAHPGAAGLIGVADQEVRRLEVLVQDARMVRRGQGLRRLRRDLDPVRERHLIDTAFPLRPREQVAGFGISGLEEEGRAVELPVEDLGDVAALAQPLAQHSQQNDLALEPAHARRLEAELEHAPRVGLVLGRQPHLTDGAGAELLDEMPVLAARDRQADRRAPAQCQLVAGGDRAARLLGVGRRIERRDAGDSHLADIDGVVPAFEEVGTVGAPRGLDSEIVGAQSLPGGIERGAGEEHLTRAGERLDARREIDHETFDQQRLGRSRWRRPFGDLTEMDADADRRQLSVAAMRRLELERKASRCARCLERDEEAVAGAVDLATLVP